MEFLILMGFIFGVTGTITGIIALSKVGALRRELDYKTRAHDTSEDVSVPKA